MRQFKASRSDARASETPPPEERADPTELESLRLAVQRGARLEALASLTSGVAHDFRNLLTVLVGNLSLVAEELRDRPAAFAKLKAARDAATRGSDLISQLLGFAGAAPVETCAVDPSEVVRNLVPLLDSALGRRVQLKTELDSNAGSITANVAQLESAIVNLAVNARDAISGHGTVTLSSSALTLDDETARGKGVAPGAYIRLCVVDDGAGIPAEWHERVFQPFFSTKRERGGTGLGLGMVRAFVHQLGGAIEIRSGVGEGTALSLLLPTTLDAGETGGVQTAPLATLPTGTEHVVVLTVDASIGATVSQILEVLGYTVTVCTDASELAIAASRSALDLLVVDGLPARAADGVTPVEQVRRRHPDAAWMCMLESKDAADGVSGQGGGVLMKPFSLANLASVVRDTLDR